MLVRSLKISSTSLAVSYGWDSLSLTSAQRAWMGQSATWCHWPELKSCTALQTNVITRIRQHFADLAFFAAFCISGVPGSHFPLVKQNFQEKQLFLKAASCHDWPGQSNVICNAPKCGFVDLKMHHATRVRQVSRSETKGSSFWNPDILSISKCQFQNEQSMH